MTVTFQLSPLALSLLDEGRITRTMLEAIAKAHNIQNWLTIEHIQENRLRADKFAPPRPPSEGILRTISGRLWGSLRASPPAIVGTAVISSIGTNVEYAGAHEFGARTAARKIVPRTKKALKFTIGGNTLIRRSVNHPGSNIPARAPIRRGVEDRLGAYNKAISDAVIKSLRS